MVAAEPQLPGPGRIRPMPRNVPTKVAHRGARDAPAACPELAEGTAGGTPALLSRLVRVISDVSFTILRPDLPVCSPGSVPRYPQPATESHKRRLPTYP